MTGSRHRKIRTRIPLTRAAVLQSFHYEPAGCLLDPRSESNELHLWHRHQHPPDCSEVSPVSVHTPPSHLCAGVLHDLLTEGLDGLHVVTCCRGKYR
jgi:hypothetical protein